METTYMLFREDGSEYHESNCPCDLCNEQGRSWCVTLYDVTQVMPLYQQEWELLQDWVLCSEVVRVVYGPSEEAVLVEMERVCEQEGWQIVFGMALPEAAEDDLAVLWDTYKQLPKQDGRLQRAWRVWPVGADCRDIHIWFGSCLDSLAKEKTHEQ